MWWIYSQLSDWGPKRVALWCCSFGIRRMCNDNNNNNYRFEYDQRWQCGEVERYSVCGGGDTYHNTPIKICLLLWLSLLACIFDITNKIMINSSSFLIVILYIYVWRRSTVKSTFVVNIAWGQIAASSYNKWHCMF